jgi:pimeloyl-ACP methyl ester carboxylesterase
MDIDSLEAVQLGNTTQWIHLRGADPSNPVLLMIQQGPGLPMMNEIRRFEATLELEQEFTVVYWDQRGCGRSLRGHGGGDDATLSLMVNDTVALLEILNERFSSKPYVMGFSMGATIGAFAGAQRPDLVTTLIAVGTDVDGVAAGDSAYDFALRTARQRGQRRAIRQLEKIGPPPHRTVKQFGTRVRWASNYRGVTTGQSYGAVVGNLIASLARSRDYALGDVLRTLRGVTLAQAALLPEINAICLQRTLPVIDVPIVMVQGRLDMVAPGSAAEDYFNALASPKKQLVWFDHSAHTPQYDEPQAFRDLLLRIRDDRRAPVSSAPYDDEDQAVDTQKASKKVANETTNESGGPQ